MVSNTTDCPNGGEPLADVRRFTLHVPLKSKARPRFAGGHGYLPRDYREWKELCKKRIKAVWEENNWEPIVSAATITFEFVGPARHDLDNLIGAVLDAGLPCQRLGFAGAWVDDRVTVFPSISASFTKGKPECIHCTINLGQRP